MICIYLLKFAVLSLLILSKSLQTIPCRHTATGSRTIVTGMNRIRMKDWSIQDKIQGTNKLDLFLCTPQRRIHDGRIQKRRMTLKITIGIMGNKGNEGKSLPQPCRHVNAMKADKPPTMVPGIYKYFS